MDLLGFAPGRKGLVLHPQFHEPFEVLDFGITAARFPFPHRSPRDTQEIGQIPLGQPHARSQREHGLTEGIVSLTVRGSLHGALSFLDDGRAKRGEGTGSRMNADVLTTDLSTWRRGWTSRYAHACQDGRGAMIRGP